MLPPLSRTTKTVRLAALLAVLVAAGALSAIALGATPGRISPALRIVNNGRHLHPYGKLVRVGNVPLGGALTPDGRYYWTVSAGAGLNDVRIVSVGSHKVVQKLPLPGASGGIVIDPRGGTAYVSGIADSTNKGTSRPKLPGGKGDVIHVFKYSKSTGKAHETGQIGVPPPPGSPQVEDFPLHRSPIAYPMHLTISGDGARLLVPLGLADRAAVVDTNSKIVSYIPVGSYPYGAAIVRKGKVGLVTNEAPGTVTILDLDHGAVQGRLLVGGHLSHPEAIVAKGHYAFVTITNRDKVAVIDTRKLRVVHFISLRIKAGIGTAPDAVAVTHNGHKLLVAESGTDRISIFTIPHGKTKGFHLLGRVPADRYPTDVAATGGKSPTLVWLSAKGLGIGPNPHGPSPFNSSTLDQSGKPTQFMPRITDGDVGIGKLPTGKLLHKLTKVASKQVPPANHRKAPRNTPLRANGPIKHVFFVVKENRSYDQILGDDKRGDGDSKLTLFGKKNTPNLHALVKRFPLVDHFYGNSEASQQGHQWTSAGNISDYEEKNWNQISNPFGDYGARGRPLQSGFYVVSFPPKGYIFDQALRQKISFFNFGEMYAGNVPMPFKQVSLTANTTDKDRTAADAKETQRKFARSDVQPNIAGGCYPNDLYTGRDILTGNWAFDSTPPKGAPPKSESRMKCFRKRFRQMIVSKQGVPAFTYVTLMNDHTRGLEAGSYTPQAMIADNDFALGQLVATVSHSKVWKSSAIFVLEDDSQDGADHVDAHRMPVAVISPFARAGAVVHTRYDQLSMLRSMELILGMHPLSLNDALATPMYGAFQSTARNISPFNAVAESQNMLATNPSGTRGARESAKYDLTNVDAIPQRDLDRLLWQSVHGQHSKAPPPGPNASADDADG